VIIVPQVVAPADTIRWAVLTIVVPAVSLVRHLLHRHHRDLHAERLAATIAAAAAPAARVWEIHMTVHLVTHAVHRHHQTVPVFLIYAHNLVVAVAPKVIADLFVVESTPMAAISLTMIARLILVVASLAVIFRVSTLIPIATDDATGPAISPRDHLDARTCIHAVMEVVLVIFMPVNMLVVLAAMQESLAGIMDVADH